MSTLGVTSREHETTGRHFLSGAADCTEAPERSVGEATPRIRRPERHGAGIPVEAADNLVPLRDFVAGLRSELKAAYDDAGRRARRTGRGSRSARSTWSSRCRRRWTRRPKAASALNEAALWRQVAFRLVAVIVTGLFG
jgi:hypothetical protein